jgi:hypothetical protein
VLPEIERTTLYVLAAAVGFAGDDVCPHVM